MANEHNELREHNEQCVNYALGCFVENVEDALLDGDEWPYEVFNNGHGLAEYIVDSANDALTFGVISCHCASLNAGVSSYTVRKHVARGALFAMVNHNPDVTGRL